MGMPRCAEGVIYIYLGVTRGRVQEGWQTQALMSKASKPSMISLQPSAFGIFGRIRRIQNGWLDLMLCGAHLHFTHRDQQWVKYKAKIL